MKLTQEQIEYINKKDKVTSHPLIITEAMASGFIHNNYYSLEELKDSNFFISRKVKETHE